MRLALALTPANGMAWTCFAIGIVVLVGGVFVGLANSFKRTAAKAADAKEKLDDAKEKLDDARGKMATASAAAASGLESFNAAAGDATEAVQGAKASTDEAASTLEQVQGILSALPENLRFAGLLILVGTALMGVATVQLGGHSLF